MTLALWSSSCEFMASSRYLRRMLQKNTEGKHGTQRYKIAEEEAHDARCYKNTMGEAGVFTSYPTP